MGRRAHRRNVPLLLARFESIDRRTQGRSSFQCKRIDGAAVGNRTRSNTLRKRTPSKGPQRGGKLWKRTTAHEGPHRLANGLSALLISFPWRKAEESNPCVSSPPVFETGVPPLALHLPRRSRQVAHEPKPLLRCSSQIDGGGQLR